MEHIDTLMDTFEERKGMYEQYNAYLESLLNILIEEGEVRYHMISGRLKREDGLREKLTKGKHKYKSLEDVTDIVGVRVVTHFASDISKIADLIEKEFKIDAENSVDKREQMDVTEFGYMSLHYVVELQADHIDVEEYKKYSGIKAEIQICSILQHAWAEIEHDLGYKVKKEVPWEVRRAFSRIASLLETADLEFDRIRATMLDVIKDEKKEG